MARKKKTEQPEATPSQLAFDALMGYLELSKFLFSDPDNSIYDVNELEPDEKFYPLAKHLAEELKIDWETMSHEDSNRIMLLMLEKSYQQIRDCIDAKSIVISWNIKEVVDKDNGSTED